MLDGLTSWLLLPLGMAMGWAWSRRLTSSSHLPKVPSPQPSGDDSESSLQILEAHLPSEDAQQTELQLTLGTLFRRRGEVERALRLHSGLLNRTDLDAGFRDEVHFELAADYQQAGLMDQAESEWALLAAGNGPRAAAAQQELLTVAEQGRDWAQALQLAARLEATQGISCRTRRAHYLCELAEQAMARQGWDEARKSAREAQRLDAGAVRPRWLLARISEGEGNPAVAAALYRGALELDPRYLDDLLPEMERCYIAAEDEKGLSQALQDLQELHPAAALWVARARQLERRERDPLPLLAEGLRLQPARSVLKAFLVTMAPRPNVVELGLSESAEALRIALEQMERSQAAFRCEQCGFAPRNRFWQCPSCRQWGTTHRVSDHFG